MKHINVQYIFIFDEFVTLFKNHKNKAVKLKQKLSDLKKIRAQAIENSGIEHKDLRAYLVQTLHTTLNILKDTPALVGPKFQVLLFYLTYNRLFWHY